MPPRAWISCWALCILLLASLRAGSTHKAQSRAKGSNSIKSGAGEGGSAPGNRTAGQDRAADTRRAKTPAQVYPCTSDKECSEGTYCHCPQHAPSRCITCRRKKKRCHRDGMCCPGNRCSNHICVPISEDIMSPLIPALDDNNKLSAKDHSWRKGQTKASLVKGHDGDPCLRSSDCQDGFCCARHFWTKICKPVLRQGEVCTRQRRKGSHGLELFQRCDCAKGLACKVWKDATSASKSRLHVCQRV